MKRKAGKSQKIAKGMPSAVLLSIAIHAALFFLAGALVVFTVVKKKEVEFEPPKAVERPKMKLKKPKPRIKKSARPKKATHILAKVNPVNMPEIQLPELGGMGGDGLGEGIVGGFDTLPDLGGSTLFGNTQSIGNDFIGTFYDLKRDWSGRDIPMDLDMYLTALGKFVRGGWKTSKLSRYYRAPRKLYTTTFMVPVVLSQVAPEAFGEAETIGYCWAVHYTGQLVHKDGIKFRFWGHGDDVMLVRVDGKIVLVACWPGRPEQRFIQLWDSSSADSRKYWLGNNRSVVGDWITLEPGVPLDMEVLIGEEQGGGFASMLLVEVEGVEYERGPQGNPLLPMFMTAKPSLDLLDVIYRDLVPGEAGVTNGPVFCDYDTSGGIAALPEPEKAETPEPEAPAEEGMRTWTGVDGKTFEAEFVTVISSKAVLKDSRGKMRKIPQDQLSLEDREFIELAQPPEFNIDFSKKSSQYIGKMSPYNPRTPPKVLDYVFSARLKQISAGLYNHELHVEFFAIGAENFGDHYILLDRQESRFMPTKENERTHEFSGKTVRLTTYELYGDFKGMKYAGYLVVVTDKRGKIITHATSNKWLFENLENLRRLSVGRYMDETCTRVFPSRPITDKY
ncbi:MAG: hypothetical protein ABFR33_04200 [Verrucomicrobiota bacterium]